jgi:chemotaxis response regulator CheB
LPATRPWPRRIWRCCRDRIGPAAVLGHSPASGLVVAAVKARRQLRVAVVSMEGNRKRMAAPDGGKVLMQLPMLSVFGDIRVSAQGISGDARRNACVEAINFLRDPKGPAER